MKRFLQLSRAPFFTAVMMPVFWGTMLAWRYEGCFDWRLLLLTLMGTVAAHAGANLLNDYYDARLGADENNPNRNPFSGGSPDIVEGRVPAGVFLRMGFTSLAVAAVCCAILTWRIDRGPGPILWITLIGMAGGILYTAPPFKLSYRGWGEICIFICFGLLPVAGSYYVQAETLPPLPFVAAVPLGLLITNIIWINEFPDHDTDRDAGKRQWVVRLGLSRARIIYYILGAMAFVSLGSLMVRGWLGHGAWLGFFALPLYLRAALILHRHYTEPASLLPAQGLTIAAHLVLGMMLSIGIAIWP